MAIRPRIRRFILITGTLLSSLIAGLASPSVWEADFTGLFGSA